MTTRQRTRLRLTTKDWAAIYEALWMEHGCKCGGCVRDEANNQRVLRKIGSNGMAAAVRGVAPGRRTLR